MDLLGLLTLALGGLGAARAAGNPFLGKPLYVNPVNSRQYETSIATASGTTKAHLREMQKVPSAYWIDVKAKIRGGGTRSVEGILQDASSKSPPELVVLIWYDLPNRDCFAKASNGEICCNKNDDGTCNYALGGDCAEGLREYTSEYADPFVDVLRAYEGKLPIVVVIEPDSLPNLATNLFHPGCQSEATQTAYKLGIKYALQQITSRAPSVSVYLDAAHGGWLGWENSMESFMKLLRSLDLPRIRGFATNVANYQPLGVQCPWCPDTGFRNGHCLNGKHPDDPCCEDPCNLLGQYNFGNNELNYAAGLVAAADSMLGMDAHVIIDTGRNGVVSHRAKCSNWCNPRDAGAGVPSTTDVANTSLVDAFFWLKTPGESDGCSEELPDGSKCPRFDAQCNSEDSLSSRPNEPRAPEAGHWFDYQVKQLAANARFEPASAASASSSCAASGGSHHGGSHHGGSNHGGSDHGGSDHGGSGHGGSCSTAYGQCGGKHWNGPTCCESGCRCRHEGDYYSQCEPPAGTHLCVARRAARSNATATVQLAAARDGPLRSAVGAPANSGPAVLIAALAAVAGAAAATFAAVRRRAPAGAAPVAGGRSLAADPEQAEGRALLEA